MEEIEESVVAMVLLLMIGRPVKMCIHAIYFSVGGFAIFFFSEFFRVDQERLTFERVDLLVSFRLPSKYEL